MDRAFYIAATGASQLQHRVEVVANNLSGVGVTAFKAEFDAHRTAPVVGGGLLPTRAYSVASTPASDLSAGAVNTTNRSLDAAINGRGWFAVQGRDGQEAYTRAGAFLINAEGLLTDATGRLVQGDGGPIQVPEGQRVEIAGDGTINALSDSQPANPTNIGRLKLVLPADADLVRGADGLFRMRNGAPAPVDETVRVAAGALEMSNVSPTDTLVSMISASRQFDTQMQLLQRMERNDEAADKLLGSSQ